jgi:outer membrane protein OmpA-like peptidoglycan-associated protein
VRVRSVALAWLVIGWNGAAGAEELVSKQAILQSLLGPSRSIGKQQRRAVNLPTVTFEFNSASLTSQGRQQLEILAQALKEGSLVDRKILIQGHTDAHGDDQYNLGLSERRALVAKEFLVSASGLEPSQLTAVGLGKTHLLPGKSEFAPEQRRIEVVVGGQ